MLGFAPLASGPIGATASGPVVFVPAPVITAPGVPRNVTVTAGVNSLSVAFLAPLSDGGAAITGFPVRLSTGEEKTVPASPANFTGLSAGVARTAQVAATNSKGTGDFSAASLPATPAPPVVVPPDSPPVDDIEAATVPASRIVRFEGSIRVVRFEGSDNRAGI